MNCISYRGEGEKELKGKNKRERSFRRISFVYDAELLFSHPKTLPSSIYLFPHLLPFMIGMFAFVRR